MVTFTKRQQRSGSESDALSYSPSSFPEAPTWKDFRMLAVALGKHSEALRNLQYAERRHEKLMKLKINTETAATVQTGDSQAADPSTACSDVWEYSHYRASLRRNGATFALMTRDGKHSLNPEEQAILLTALNRPNVTTHTPGANETP